MDGGSSDNSPAIIKRHADSIAYWVSEPDNGQADAINRGLERSTGEVMGWLNSDDRLMPGALSLVGLIFAAYPSVMWITGRSAIMDAHGRLAAIGPRRGFFRRAIRNGRYHNRGFGFIQQEGTFWRRALWEKAGGLDPKRYYTADFELWQRFAAHADLVMVQSILAMFRQHDQQKSADQSGYYAEIGVSGPAVSQRMRRWVLHPIAARFAPQIVYESGRWQFKPGRYFRPGLG
ncbi:MAG: glycosyltransferase [Anaerolineae bacterium]